MYRKKNTLVSVIRANQTRHGVTELTIFESDEYANTRVCFSGLLDDFNAVGKLDLGMTTYRQDLLRRRVQMKVVFHEKLFIWLENEVPVNQQNMKENLDKFVSLLQECRNEYKRAQRIENNIYSLLAKMGINDPDSVPISLPEAVNLTDAISYQLYENADYIGAIIETVSKTVQKSGTTSA